MLLQDELASTPKLIVERKWSNPLIASVLTFEEMPTSFCQRGSPVVWARYPSHDQSALFYFMDVSTKDRRYTWVIGIRS